MNFFDKGRRIKCTLFIFLVQGFIASSYAEPVTLKNLSDFIQANKVHESSIDGNMITQLRVEEQGPSYCGYHALKNLILTYQFVFEGKDGARLSQPIFNSEFKNKWEQMLKVSNEESDIPDISIKDNIDDYGGSVDEMTPAYARAIIKHEEGGKYKDKIYTLQLSRKDIFTNPIITTPKKLISLEVPEPLDALNNGINALCSGSEGFYGIAFPEGKGFGHWIACALVKVQNKQFFLCFNSWLNKSIVINPIIQFIAKQYFKNQENGLLEAYYKEIIPNLATYFKNQKQDEELIELMTSKGSGSPGGKKEAALGVILVALEDPTTSSYKNFIQSFNKVFSGNHAMRKDFVDGINHVLTIWDDSLYKSTRDNRLKVVFKDGAGNLATEAIIEADLKKRTAEDMRFLQKTLSAGTHALGEKLIQLKDALKKLSGKLEVLRQRLSDLKKAL